jgi:serine/threonine protein kinase
MPTPLNIDEFLDLVQKSGVVDEKRLTAYLDKLRSSTALPAVPKEVASQMVDDGLLTEFQADQLKQGKWKRFTLGKYKVLERLGAGGMGSVYLCEHKLMRRRVAVKVLPAAKAEDPSSLERFYREARAVAALDHPNIVRAYDIDQDENLHFLVMEHIDGASLQEIIKKTGPMDALRAAHYMRQAALGLQHAHETATLVHRDIKPGNILVDRNGIVKILDMGLARFFHDEDDILTKKYDESVLGTADYLAPEQALDSHDVDIRADIYSLGATFYFCLTGRTPFADGTVAQKLIWHQTRQPKAIRTIRSDVPEGLVAVIDRMMAKDKFQRFQTPIEVVEALAPFTQTPIPPPPDIEMPKLSRALGPNLGEPSMAAPKTGGGETSPQPRKLWQVNTPAASQVPTASPPGGDIRKTGVGFPVAPPTGVPSLPRPVGLAASTKTLTSGPATPGNGPGRAGAVAPQPVAPAVRQTASAVEEEISSWASLAPSTDELGHHDTDPTSGRTSGRRGSGVKIDPNRRMLWVILGVCAVFAVAGVALTVSLLRSGDPNQAQQHRERPPLVFDPAAGGGFKTLQDAIENAQAGDRILLKAAEINECVTIAKPLTIEPDGDLQVVWGPPRNLPNENITKLIYFNAAGACTIKGKITFTGEDRIDTALLLYGKCPGLTIDGVQIVKCKKCGIYVTTCEGSKENPVSLSGITFALPQPTQVGVFLDLAGRPGAQSKNRFLVMRDLKFDGPGSKIAAAKGKPGAREEVTPPDGVAIDERDSPMPK